MADPALNGSVNALAEAFRSVIVDVGTPVQQDVAAIRRDVSSLEKLINEKDTQLEQRITTLDGNVQAQLAQYRQDISADFKQELKAR